MSKQNFDSEELAKLFHKIHTKLDWLTCFVKECCAKIPVNIGNGTGLFKRFYNGKWEFKSLIEGDNITITETTTDVIISSTAVPFDCTDVEECLGISESGQSNKFLNEQGDFITVSGSEFTCSDLDTCSTSNLAEGTRLYFTDNRAVTALTGQNISLFTNNSGFITSSALSPYLTIASASSIYQPIGSYLTSISGLNISQLNNDSGYITESNADLKYYPLTNPNNYISNISSLDVTTALGYTPYDSTNPSGFLTSSSLTPYLLSSTAASTYQPIGSYLTTISGLNISLLNNDSNYLTSSTASSTYEPIITPGTTSQYYRGDKTFQTLDKSTVGLGNVDNTSDSSKPISTATQTALNLKANKSDVETILFKTITPTVITGKTVETSIYSIPLPTDVGNYIIRINSQAQPTTLVGSQPTHRLRVGIYNNPIDGVTGVNAIGNQTLLAQNIMSSAANSYPITRNYSFYGGSSGSIFGIQTNSLPTDEVNGISYITLASKDFTTQHYLYLSFNPSNVGTIVTHNQILVTAIKI